MARRKRKTVATQAGLTGDDEEVQVSYVVTDDIAEIVGIPKSLEDAWQEIRNHQRITKSVAAGRNGVCPICGGRSVRTTCGSAICIEMWVLGHLTVDGEARWLMLPEKHALNLRWPRVRQKILSRRANRAKAKEEENGN